MNETKLAQLKIILNFIQNIVLYIVIFYSAKMISNGCFYIGESITRLTGVIGGLK